MKHSKLFLCKGFHVYFGSIVDNSLHNHHAIQIGISYEKPFEIYYEKKWQAYSAAIIPSNVPHELKAPFSDHILILFDHESLFAQQLSIQYNLQDQIINIDPFLEKLRLHGSEEFLTNNIQSCTDAISFVQTVFSKLMLKSDFALPDLDKRISQSLSIIASLDEKKISLADLAGEVNLSEGRFIHLFKEQVGIPVRRYLLWSRLIEAVTQVLAGTSLTTAAHNTGFADSAHLSRTFRLNFGLTPSEIFQNSQFIQVNSCLDS